MKLKRPEMNFNLSLSREFTLREKVLFGILGLLLLGILYVYAVHLPVTNGIEAANTGREEAETEITVLEAEKEHMDALKAELEETRDNTKAVSIPSYDNLDLLMAFLNNVLSGTKEYSLSFPGVDLPGDGGSNIARRHMQLTFKADSYPSARATIDKLQGAPYRCLLNETSISPLRGGEGGSHIFSGPVEVKLSMVFYEVVS